MAATSVSIRSSTVETPFHDLPAQATHFFQVNAGIEVDHALRTAWALDACVRDVMDRAIAGDDIDANLAYLCKLALEAAGALRQASGAEEVLPALQR